MSISVKQLLGELFGEIGLSADNAFYVAYSGGVDSTVLLHLMAQAQQDTGFQLRALHVNHGLHSDARRWEDHCAYVCSILDVPLITKRLRLDDASEATAREARYDWFATQLGKGDVLLTAHHEQDRVETLLFNLMRGAGSSGLSSLRASRKFHQAKLVRPLLNYSKSDITETASELECRWIEDSSNQNLEYSRNEIRHKVLPTLTEFRTDAISNIARAANNLEQENELLREVAIGDLVEVREQALHPVDRAHALCVDDIAHLTPARQANLLRFWLQSMELLTPTRRFLGDLVQAIAMPPQSTAIFQERGMQFRFYRGFMYVMPAQQQLPDFGVVRWDNLIQPLDIYSDTLRLDATSKLRDYVSCEGDAVVALANKTNISNPKAFQGHSLNLKKWLQESSIPPWRRESIPLLTVQKRDASIVLGAVDQQIQNEWVYLECPLHQS